MNPEREFMGEIVFLLMRPCVGICPGLKFYETNPISCLFSIMDSLTVVAPVVARTPATLARRFTDPSRSIHIPPKISITDGQVFCRSA
jgi:hypothetical protein